MSIKRLSLLGDIVESLVLLLGLFEIKLFDKHVRPAKTHPNTCILSKDMFALKSDNDPDRYCGKTDRGCRVMPQCSVGRWGDFPDIHAKYRLSQHVNNRYKWHCPGRNTHCDKRCRKENHCEERNLFHLRGASAMAKRVGGMIFTAKERRGRE